MDLHRFRRKLLRTVPKHYNTLDDAFLLLLLPRSWSHKWKLYQDLRQQRKLARQGILDGYPVLNFQFRFLNPQNAPFLYTEIFVAEPYFFRTENEEPLIIDGGVNVGVSIAYFKWLYPHSRIIGFEPHPAVYEIAKDNVEHNGMREVHLFNAALAATNGKAELHSIQDDMASTVTDRLAVRGETSKSILVDTVRLSEYISEEVEFLKLDIEGTEQSVLEEIEDHLGLVNRMFIEFHHTHGDSGNRLSRLLDVLDRHGFWYLITSPLGARRNAAVAPLRVCGPISSLSIFVKKPGL